MPRRKLTSGQSLVGAVSARTTNDTVRVLEYADRVGLWQPARPDVVRRRISGDVLWAKNSTSADLRIGEIAGITSLGIDSSNAYGELERELTFECVDVTSVHVRRYGVAMQPIERHQWGPMAFAGCVAARVNVTDTSHTHGYLASGSTTLTSNYGGSAELRLVAAATGEQLTPVVLNCGGVMRKAIADADITAGSSAAASVYINGSDVGSVTAWFNWMETGTASIASGTEMLIQWFDDESKWVVIAAECQA